MKQTFFFWVAQSRNGGNLPACQRAQQRSRQTQTQTGCQQAKLSTASTFHSGYLLENE